MAHRARRLERGAVVRLGLGALAVGFVSGLPVLSGTFSPPSDAAAVVTLQAFPTGTPCTYEDSWQAPRGTDASGRPLYHEGVDIIARTGTPIYAASAGRITRLSTSNRGGIQLYLTRTDGSGTYFFHAHLSGYAPGLKVGDNVAAGQLIAYVGQTGDAQYSVPHLHFEVHPGGGAPVNPHPIVRAVDACYGGRPPATVTPPATTSPRPTNPTVTAPPTVTTTPGATAPSGRRTTTTQGTVAGSIVRGGAGSSTPAGTAPPATAPPATAPPVAEPPETDGPVVVGDPGGLVPVAPARLADSRRGSGLARLAGGQAQALAVAGRGGVAADATTASLTFTVVNPSAAGYLAAYPCGSRVPRTSTVNFVAGRTVTNTAIVGLGTGESAGQVCVVSNVATDVQVDVGAYATPSATVGFVPQAPRRLVDTRETSPLTTDTVLQIAVGEPGVAAVTLNVTAVDADGPGAVTVWPCAADQPASPTLVTGGGDIVPNTATVALGDDGLLCAAATTTTELVVDLMGTWRDGGLRPAAVTPVRLLDTRTSGTRVAAGRTVVIPVAGTNGLPAGATAAQLNITSVDTRADGYVTVWPCGQARPTASNLNPVAGRILANGAVVGLGDGGAVCVYSHSSTHLVVDVTGVLS